MEKCWICGKKADSEEHKIKASDIKRRMGKKFEGYYGTEDEGLQEIKSYKDKLLKFPKVICINCNNNITKSADDSYDEFIEYVDRNFDILIEMNCIDFSLIYKNKWKEKKLDLYRYFAKHAGCKIFALDTKETIDLSKLSKFILGGKNIDNFYVFFQLNEVVRLYDASFENTNHEHLRINPLGNSKTLSFESMENTMFCGSIINHFLRIEWVFTNNKKIPEIINFNNSNEIFELLSFDNYYPYSFSDLENNQDIIEYLTFGRFNEIKESELMDYHICKYEKLMQSNS